MALTKATMVSANLVRRFKADGTEGNTLADRWSRALRSSDFGIKCDGSDETAKYIAAIAECNAKKLPLLFDNDGTGTLLLSGSDNITSYYSVDFGGNKIDISQFTGKFLIERPPEYSPTTYLASSPEVQAIVTKGETLWGGVINAWASLTNLKNAYIKITTNVNAFEYRNELFPVVARNLLYRGGILAHHLDYPIFPSSIVSIQLFPVPDKVTTFGNAVVVKESDPCDFIVAKGSRLRIHDLQLNHNSQTVSTGMIWINNEECYDLELDNLTTPYGTKYMPGGTIAASYTFRVSDSYNVYMHDLHSSGGEWGTIGTDEVTNCHLERCSLSRYDSHRPFHGTLSGVDCNFGMRGLSTQGAGDKMVWSRCYFLDASSNDYTPNFALPYIFNSRGDMGGICDADAILDNCTFANNLNQTIHVFAQTVGPEFSNGLPSGSPYRQVSFRTITIINPTVKTIPGSNSSVIDFGLRESRTGADLPVTAQNSPDMPFNITLNNVKSREGGLCSFSINNTRPASASRATSVTNATTNPYEMITNLEINMTDCVWTDRDVSMAITDTTDTYSLRMNMKNVRQMSDIQPVFMRLYMPALISGTGCRIREIRPFFNSATLLKPMGFSFSNSEIYPNGTIFISWSETANNRFCNLSACNIIGDSMAALSKMAAYKLAGCQYFIIGTGKVNVPISSVLTGDTGSFLYPTWLNMDNNYQLATAQGSFPIKVPAPGSAIYMVVGFTEDGTIIKRVKVYRSTGTGGGIALTKFPTDSAAPILDAIYLP
ncbi:tail fiber protein [Klebsiella phage VLCpiA2a]|nr:tail fiber protein [Klebsiella phage VLCpiA2a]